MAQMLGAEAFTAKRWLEAALGLSSDSLHILLGALLFGVAWRVAGRRPWVAVAIVAVLEVVNESLDRSFHGSWRLGDTAIDVINSLLLPCVLAAAATISGSRALPRVQLTSPRRSGARQPL